MSDTHPPVAPSPHSSTRSSRPDFTAINEVFVHRDGQLQHERTVFIIRDPETAEILYGSLPVPKKQVSVQQAYACLEKVPAERIYPVAPPSIFICPGSTSNQYHVKGPRISSYAVHSASDELAQRFLHEAEIMQRLHCAPHSNIVRFQGCVVRDNRIVGLAMNKLQQTLKARIAGEAKISSADEPSVDRWSCWQGLCAAAKHIHGLGLAHNDINPANIMFASSIDTERAILIDFGSCTALGEELREIGTAGWNEGFEEVSSVNNDRVGLLKIGLWLGLDSQRLQETLDAL